LLTCQKFDKVIFIDDFTVLDPFGSQVDELAVLKECTKGPMAKDKGGYVK
jgi:hypothetical protein